MAAFEKLGANGKKVTLEFEPRRPRSQLKVRLYNEKESIELKKINSEETARHAHCYEEGTA